MSMETVLGQPSWKIHSDLATAFVTQTGGMVGPVEFDLGGRRRQVFHVAPWAEERLDVPPILQALRGDFFCMPFGMSQLPYEGEVHPLHGETANEPWDLVSHTATRVELSLQTRIRPAQVTKTISVRPGESVVYSRHVVSGGEGPITYGHHAMPRFPNRPGSGLLEVGHYTEGLVFPGNFEEASQGGYTSLKPGAFFETLSAVPCKDGTTADLTRYPARPGYEDLVILMNDPDASFAWSAVTFPEEGYVWFCLKDPRVLPSTMLWISNGGRHYHPWNGRHRGVMGIEEVCTGLPSGIGEAVGPNLMAERGHKTHTVLSKSQDLVVNVIVGAVAVPEGFGRVLAITPEEGKVVIEGRRWPTPVEVRVDTAFLYASA